MSCRLIGNTFLNNIVFWYCSCIHCSSVSMKLAWLYKRHSRLFIARSAIYVGGVFWRDVHLFACCLLWQICVIFCKGICTGVRHMLTGVLIKRSIIGCFSPKWTSFISDLGAVTVDSGSQILVIFTKSDQFHQRVRGGNCGSRVPKMDPFWQSMFLASIWRGHHLRRFAPLLCRVLSSYWDCESDLA